MTALAVTQMISRLKYFGLVKGILLVIFSFLFFARNQITYNFLFLLGAFLAFVCFLIIIFGKGTWIQKIKWFAIVLIGVVIQQVTEPFLIDTSYRIYLVKHRNSLATINKILNKYPGTFILGDSVRSVIYSVPDEEQRTLLDEKRKLGVWMIESTDKGIYYGLWGFLDVRLGVTFWTSSATPDERYRKIDGTWHR